jgi:plastocyanin
MRYVTAFGGLVLMLAVVACGGSSGTSNTPTTPTPPTTTVATTVATTTVATTTVPPTSTIPSTTTTTTPTSTPTITISSNGVSPQRITVSPGTRVMFVNNDSRAHEMNSDPHPTHGDCPPIDDVGFLAPGQSKLTGNLNVVRTCGYHDHNQPDTANLKGQIVVQ